MADSTRASGAKKTGAKSTARTSTAKKTAAKATAKKATAKKATAKKTTAKKATAKKATAKKATAKKATPKKATTKAAPRTAPAKVSSVAAAADRAGGERARRRTTPLLTGPSAEVPSTASSKGGSRTSSTSPRPPKPKKPSAPRQPRLTVVPGPDGAPPAATPTARRRPPARRSTSTASRPAARSTAAASRRPVSPAVAPAQPVATPGTPDSGQALVPGLAELLSVLLSAGQLTSRTLGQAAGAAAGEDWERRFAETLHFLQRRVKGDYAVDDFGFDRDFTTHTVFPVLRLLKDKWFRVEVRGIENIPADSGALLVSNHSGTVAIDSVITQLAIHDAHPQQRFLRMLGADLVFQLPVVGDVARKTGATLASNADAERLLRGGELVGVWPEGFKGVGKPFRERYKLQRFGRGGFVSAAIRSEVPIIPCSVVGAEEVYPMIGNMKTVARLLGAPYAPITPFFPLLGPLGLIPLPSKWIIEFGEPVDTASLGPAAAEDPMLVFELTDQVRETIQQTLYSVLVTRRSVFF